MINNNQSKRILFLDYMRVLAFSLVILGHKFSKDLLALSQDHNIHVTSRLIYEFLFSISYGGAMGVVVFFLVSGYIITHVLQTENTMEFYIKRIFRIYPLYIVAVILEIAVRYAHGSNIPPLEVIIPRLLLLGDFFGTPLALAGVEWTLRIEVMFYLFMGCVRKCGILPHGNLLSMLLLLLTYALMSLPPFPASQDFHNAYFSTYTPFLFMGVIVYLLEKRIVNSSLAIICLLAMFFMHIHLIELYNKGWGRFNYAAIGTIIFIASWRLREYMKPKYVFLLLSELTYAIYLFHNWMWEYIHVLVRYIGISLIPDSLQILILLMIFCYVANKIIERKGVFLGKFVSARILTAK